ncbi:HU family DNA-binding protein [Phocaeicola coprocola]
MLVALEEEVCRGLCNGEIVRLGELGSLQVGVKSEGVRLEADFHESMINKIWVRFRPGMVLKGMLDGAAFERVSPRKEAGRAGKGMRYERE